MEIWYWETSCDFEKVKGQVAIIFYILKFNSVALYIFNINSKFESRFILVIFILKGPLIFENCSLHMQIVLIGVNRAHQ